jgi:hypothetical protein
VPAFVDDALMGDLADIDRVGEDIVEMASAEEPAAGRSPLAVKADGDANILSVKALFQSRDAADFEIALARDQTAP